MSDANREIRPVGATSEMQVDVRILCATNRDLSAEVEKGRFRQDLYYRLMVFPITLPPLRERREDVPALAAHFLKRYAEEYRVELPGFTQDALDALSSYNWPGNIRELENEIQRLMIQAATRPRPRSRSGSPARGCTRSSRSSACGWSGAPSLPGSVQRDSSKLGRRQGAHVHTA